MHRKLGAPQYGRLVRFTIRSSFIFGSVRLLFILCRLVTKKKKEEKKKKKKKPDLQNLDNRKIEVLFVSGF